MEDFMSRFVWGGEGCDKFEIYFTVTWVYMEVCLVVTSGHLCVSIQ
jgi:hypothetical protein